MNAKTFAILTALFILFLILDLIRRQKMTFKYSLFWLAASCVTVLMVIYDKALFRLAELAGFQLPSNFIFFIFLAFLSALCLFLTVYINEQNSRTEALAQNLAILDYKIRKLQEKISRTEILETEKS